MAIPDPLTDSTRSNEPFTEFGPARGWQFVDLVEAWRFRELFWFLTVRNIKVRYKQTLIGITWAVVRPLLVMLAFVALFELMGRAPATGNFPYAVTLYTALLPWQLFATAVTQSSSSLVADQNLVKKVYFPRIILLVAPMLAALLDFAIAFVILIGMMAYYAILPGWAILALPLLVIAVLLFALGLGLWLSALNAVYRDVGHGVPFLIQIGFFVSPVIYETVKLIPPHWQFVYNVNPMAGILEGFRWSVLGASPPPASGMLIGFMVSFAILLSGLVFFRRMETTIVDRV